MLELIFKALQLEAKLPKGLSPFLGGAPLKLLEGVDIRRGLLSSGSQLMKRSLQGDTPGTITIFKHQATMFLFHQAIGLYNYVVSA